MLVKNIYTVLVCFEPIFSPTSIGYQGNVERVGILHFFYHDALYSFFFVGKYREVEFVVYL